MFSRIRASVMTSKLAEVEDERFLSSKLDSNDSDDDSRLREESDCHYDDIVLEPSPAVFVPSTHQRVISCDDNWARTSRPPQRSVTEKISEKRQLLSTSPPGPNQILQHKKESPEFMATLTGDKDNVIKIQEKPGKLDSWFKGSSEPVNFGIPVKECEEQIVAPPSTPLRPLNKLQRKSTAFSTKSPQASVSRFSFFSTPSKASQSLPTGDELLDIDIQTALAPSISPESYDAATFKNLLSNAESILTRMQVAYKERALSLRDLQAEKEAQDEEIEESNTRADHLKMQLADMAEKFAEQEKTMTEMVEELAHERQLRKAEEEARKRSIALVKAPPNIAASSSRDGRDSGIGMASDSGFESGDESSSESVFSRSRDGAVSPSGTILSYQTNGSLPESYQHSDISVSSASYSQAIVQTIQPFSVSAARPPNVKRTSTFQKVLKGLAKDSVDEEDESSTGCTSCQGASPAVNELRKENGGLKDRIAGLEQALDGCLALVGNLQ